MRIGAVHVRWKARARRRKQGVRGFPARASTIGTGALRLPYSSRQLLCDLFDRQTFRERRRGRAAQHAAYAGVDEGPPDALADLTLDIGQWEHHGAVVLVDQDGVVAELGLDGI